MEKTRKFRLSQSAMIILVTFIMIGVSMLGFLAIYIFERRADRYLQGYYYLEKVVINNEDFVLGDASNWSDEKENAFYEYVDSFDSSFRHQVDEKSYFSFNSLKEFAFSIENEQNDRVAGGSYRWGYNIGFRNEYIEGQYVNYSSVFARLSLKKDRVTSFYGWTLHGYSGSSNVKMSRSLFEVTGAYSYFEGNKQNPNQNKFVLQYFKDQEGNSFQFVYGRTKSSSGDNNNGGSGAIGNYANYTISKLIIAGIEQDMTTQANALAISSYGSTLKLDTQTKNMRFSGTLMTIHNPASYTLSGKQATFTDDNLKLLASAEIDGSKVRLIIGGGVVLEYTAV
jgi:hypothetical protein